MLRICQNVLGGFLTGNCASAPSQLVSNEIDAEASIHSNRGGNVAKYAGAAVEVVFWTRALSKSGSAIDACSLLEFRL